METNDNSNTPTTPKKQGPLRVARTIFNIILLLGFVIVVVQNANRVIIDFLWTSFEISLALLVFISGAMGSLVTLLFFLFKKKKK